MMRISATDVRDDLAEIVNRVAYGGERIVLHRRGKDVAAIVSMDDVARLKELEDRQDYADAERALADMKAKGEKPIPWEKAKAALQRKPKHPAKTRR